MSAIHGTSGASPASDIWASRKAQMHTNKFAKADGNGNGSVEKTELTALLAKASEKTGQSLDASTAFTTMDANSDGALDSNELQQGMEKLMPPRSTVDFAQSRSSGATHPMEDFFSTLDSDGDGSLNSAELQALADKVKEETGVDVSEKLSELASESDGSVSKDTFMVAMRPDAPPPGAGGPPQGAGGPPPPGGVQGMGGVSGVSSTDTVGQSYDPLDINQDGVVSEMERLVAALTTDSETSTTGAASEDTASANRFDLAQFASRMYTEIARNWSSTGNSSALNTVA